MWPAESERLHLAALTRRRVLAERVVTTTGDDPRALLAELARPRAELRGLTPGEVAATGGTLYRRALRLYATRQGNTSSH